MIVIHHGLEGNGNKSASNYQRHDQPFREGVVSSPFAFTGISIVEFLAASKS
jgi:hypothetical protein